MGLDCHSGAAEHPSPKIQFVYVKFQFTICDLNRAGPQRVNLILSRGNLNQGVAEGMHIIPAPGNGENGCWLSTKLAVAQIGRRPSLLVHLRMKYFVMAA